MNTPKSEEPLPNMGNGTIRGACNVSSFTFIHRTLIAYRNICCLCFQDEQWRPGALPTTSVPRVSHQRWWTVISLCQTCSVPCLKNVQLYHLIVHSDNLKDKTIREVRGCGSCGCQLLLSSIGEHFVTSALEKLYINIATTWTNPAWRHFKVHTHCSQCECMV